MRYKPPMLNARCDGSSKARVLGGFSLAALALTLAGCGDSSQDPAEAFIGSWIYSSEASGSAACPGTDALGETPTGNKTFARGISYALVDLTPLTLDRNVVCDYGFDVAGTIATGVPGQGCALRGGDLFTLTSWTFKLLSATTAEELASAEISSTIPGQTTATICLYTMMAHLTRVSKD
jgi:hypothetical protein